MLIPEAVRRLQEKLAPCRDLLPTGTKLIYEFSITPDEGATSEDGYFVLVTPQDDRREHYVVLSKLDIHYNLGQDEDFEIKEVRQWLQDYRDGISSSFSQSHYQHMIPVFWDEIPRFLAVFLNGEIARRPSLLVEGENEEIIFSEILSN